MSCLICATQFDFSKDQCMSASMESLPSSVFSIHIMSCLTLQDFNNVSFSNRYFCSISKLPGCQPALINIHTFDFPRVSQRFPKYSNKVKITCVPANSSSRMVEADTFSRKEHYPSNKEEEQCLYHGFINLPNLVELHIVTQFIAMFLDNQYEFLAPWLNKNSLRKLTIETPDNIVHLIIRSFYLSGIHTLVVPSNRCDYMNESLKRLTLFVALDSIRSTNAQLALFGNNSAKYAF